MYDLISKMPFNRAMNIIVIIFGCLVAPYWYLINVFPEVLLNKDIFQITLYCTAISLPPYFLHFILMLMSDRRFKSKVGKAMDFKFKIMAFLGLTVGAGFYLLVVIFYDESFNKPEKIQFSVCTHALLLAAGYLGTSINDLQRRWLYAKITTRRLGLQQTKIMYWIVMINKLRGDFRTQGTMR